MNEVIGQAAREALGDTTRRCTATNRNGERCGRAPIVGGFVCFLHGGGVPAVQKSARERLLAMVDPALDALLRFLRTAPPCEHCGRTDADRDPSVLRAVQLVLDRCGYHPTVSVVTPPSRPPEHLAWIPRDRLEQMNQWIADARTAMERGEPTPDAPEAIDAVLVDTESETDDHLE